MNYYVNTILELMGVSFDTLKKEDDLGLSLIETGSHYLEYIGFESHLKDTINSKNPIILVSDYDTDGICSFIIYYAAFSMLGLTDRIRVLLPDSLEGYGFNLEGLNRIYHQLSSFGDIYTADNGVLADEAILKAKDLGYNVIVTDHHLRLDGRSLADVVIDPNQPNCPSLFKHSSGAMVVWKLFQSFFQKHYPDFLWLWDELLLFGGISLVGDMMKLIGENRQIVKFSLNRINQDGFYESLTDLCYQKGFHTVGDIFQTWIYIFDEFLATKSLSRPLDVSFFGFYVSPLFNAPRRVTGGAKASYLTFLLPMNQRINAVRTLFDINDERKSKMQKLMRNIDINDTIYDDSFSLCVINAHSGYAGLVSGQISQKLLVPSLCFSLPDEYYASYDGLISEELHQELYNDNPIIKASGRSGGVVNLHQLISDFNDEYEVFINFGGHEDALGLSLYYRDYVNILVKYLPQFAKDYIFDFEVKNSIDMPLDKLNAALLLDALDILDTLEPFGVGFEKPYFTLPIESLKNHKYQLMGKDQNHIKWRFDNFDVILWNGSDQVKSLNNSKGYLYGDVQINSFRGMDSLQFIVKIIDDKR